MAHLQEDESILLTPYEKNLEFWRQLWRVVERSDVVVQIVDARNPLLFRCEDLEKYVKEVSENKLNLILINKSDFLTEDQRQQWINYFSQQGIRVVFFSAELASMSENQEKSNLKSEDCKDVDETNENIEETKKSIANLQCAVDESANALNRIIDKIEEMLGKTNLREQCENVAENSSLLNTSELIELFKTIHSGPKVRHISITIHAPIKYYTYSLIPCFVEMCFHNR